MIHAWSVTVRQGTDAQSETSPGRSDLIRVREERPGWRHRLRRLSLGVARPFVRLWIHLLEGARDDMLMPDDPPLVHSIGVGGHRILIVGGAVSVGWGVASHHLSIPGTLARSLTAHTGRGATVNLVVAPRLKIAGVVPLLRDLDLTRFDAIIVAVGTTDATDLTTRPEWAERLEHTLVTLADAAPGARLVVAGIPPLRAIPRYAKTSVSYADRRATILNDQPRRTSESFEKATFVPLTTPLAAGYSPTSIYERWGARLATVLATGLPSRAARAGLATRAGLVDGRRESREEARRQRSVDALPLADLDALPRIKRIVGFARIAFGTEAAVFSIIDRDWQLNHVRVGIESSSVPRFDSFCSQTIRDDVEFIIPDARVDERFRTTSLVVGAPHIRFYAGFPVEAPTGERIGALCVFDPHPREMSDVDVPLLRELALAIQVELWTLLTTPVEPTESEVHPRRSFSIPPIGLSLPKFPASDIG